MKIRLRHHTKHGGFTIIELMIATLVFSVILMVVTFGLLQIGRTYYKGVTMSKTQAAARRIMDSVSQDIQYTSGTFRNSTTMGEAVCIGSRRYNINLGSQLTAANNVLYVDNNSASDCARDSFNAGDGDTELLEPNMRVTKFAVNSLSGNLYNIVIRVVYGDTDLLVPPANDTCKNTQAGTQFCAVSELNTTVQRRVQ